MFVNNSVLASGMKWSLGKVVKLESIQQSNTVNLLREWFKCHRPRFCLEFLLSSRAMKETKFTSPRRPQPYQNGKNVFFVRKDSDCNECQSSSTLVSILRERSRNAYHMIVEDEPPSNLCIWDLRPPMPKPSEIDASHRNAAC